MSRSWRLSQRNREPAFSFQSERNVPLNPHSIIRHVSCNNIIVEGQVRVVDCDLIVMPREEPISAGCEFLANVVPETIGHGHILTSLIGLSDVRITKREFEFFREYVEQFT